MMQPLFQIDNIYGIDGVYFDGTISISCRQYHHDVGAWGSIKTATSQYIKLTSLGWNDTPTKMNTTSFLKKDLPNNKLVEAIKQFASVLEIEVENRPVPSGTFIIDGDTNERFSFRRLLGEHVIVQEFVGSIRLFEELDFSGQYLVESNVGGADMTTKLNFIEAVNLISRMSSLLTMEIPN